MVETKATEEFQKATFRQVQSYLRAAHLSVGLLLHFGPHPRFYRFLSPTKRSPQSPSDPPIS